MSHGFDDEGRRFDANGDLHEWWSNATITAFGTKKRCLRRRYDTYEVAGRLVSGRLTLGATLTLYSGYRRLLSSRRTLGATLTLYSGH